MPNTRKDYTTDNEFSEIVFRSLSWREVLIRLGLTPAGGNYTTVKARTKQLGLNTSHFLGKGARKGKYGRVTDLQTILVENSSYASTDSLRKRLLNEGYKEKKCESCNNIEWMGRPIPLELHHINGNRTDNRIENLAILCPNCHSFTNNYRGKNISALSSTGRGN